MNRIFSILMIVGLIAGVAAGAWCHDHLSATDAKAAADNFSIITDVFLRLIKMIIAPLVLSTLIAGVAHMESAGAMGRVGIKTLSWFLGAAAASLVIGLVFVQLFQPGAGLNLPIPDAKSLAAAAGPVDASGLSLKGFVTHLFPRSIIEAMANNEILQIVVFSVFAGVAILSTADRAPAVVALANQVSSIMLKITSYVMNLAPLAIFSALAAAISLKGLEVLVSYAKFIGSFYAGIGALWGVLTLAGLVVVGPRIFSLIAGVREPVLIAFSTATSEAAYPKLLERLQAFGVTRRIASFVLPLGYSFNLDGSTMYTTFAALFIAQAYGVHMSFADQATLAGMMLIMSKGIAGVPRASLVVIAAALPFFKLPEAGIALVLGVDQLLDMGRSATNVLGNAIASAVVARWEGELGPPVSDDQASSAKA